MSIEIKITVDGNNSVDVSPNSDLNAISARLNELVARMGDTFQPFPNAKIGGYMSHFRMTWEFLVGEMAGQLLNIVSPPAAQTVAWGDPFIYKGPDANHRIQIPLPEGSMLSSTIQESDFANRPSEFFQIGKESIWLQILNLDAKMDTELGPIRIILGETLLREHPDMFQPSLGIAQSLGSSGFPAKLYFNPIALLETPFGLFRATHGTLTYGRVTGFPPVGTPVTISDCVPVESVADLRASFSADPSRGSVEPVARIVALSHPIDMPIQLDGSETYMMVERAITGASGGYK